jgi:hypothetical protein
MKIVILFHIVVNLITSYYLKYYQFLLNQLFILHHINRNSDLLKEWLKQVNLSLYLH